MRAYLLRAADEIDAAVFSGDVLESQEERAELRERVERWLHALDARDKEGAAEPQGRVLYGDEPIDEQSFTPLARRATTPVQGQPAPAQLEVLRFLLGEGPLRGAHFGGVRPRGERGRWWWRRELLEAFPFFKK